MSSPKKTRRRRRASSPHRHNEKITIRIENAPPPAQAPAAPDLYAAPSVDELAERRRYEEEQARRYRILRSGRFVNVIAGGIIGAAIFAVLADELDSDIISYLEREKSAVALSMALIFAAIGGIAASKFQLFNRFLNATK